MLYEEDCISFMKTLDADCVNFTLTDIPYSKVSRSSNGLRNLDKDKADILTFDLQEFLEQVWRISNNSICIFCGKEQFSDIYNFFSQKKGTVRPIVWEKTNPSPMNGQHIYVSGVELAVWFKKSGAKTFNAHYKNTVFRYSNGKRTFHPTQKNLFLFEELIQDNTNKGDIVFDPCMGSGTTAIAAIKNQREWLGCELDPYYYIKAKERIEEFCKKEGYLLPLKTKSVKIKTGDHFSVTEVKMDNNVKAAPLNPRVAAAIRGEGIAEEAAKKKGKEENKALDKKESERKKKNRKAEQVQKKKSVSENKKLLAEREKKKA